MESRNEAAFMKRPAKMKKYLLSLPVELWERLLAACGNEWGKLAQFIRAAVAGVSGEEGGSNGSL